MQDRRKRWALLLRLGVSVCLLGFLFHQLGGEVRWHDLLPDREPSSLAWLVGAGLLILLSYVLSTVRWQQVLHALDLRDPFRRLLSHSLAGQFISNALPTTIGGDVLRVSRLSRDTGDAPGSFASVVIERLSGWIVLPIITFAAFALNPALRHLGAQSRLASLIAGGTLLALVLVLWAADHERVGGRFRDREGWVRFIGAVHLGVTRLRRHPLSALSVVAAGLIYQFVLVVAATMTAKALGIHIGITSMMAFFPAVLIAQVLPISVAGLGVREFMLVWLLGAVGVPKEQALALGILIWALTVVTSLVGAPAYAVGGGQSGLPLEGAVV